VAAVGKDGDPYPLLKRAICEVELIIENLAVVEHPRLIVPIVLVAVQVGDLSSVS